MTDYPAKLMDGNAVVRSHLTNITETVENFEPEIKPCLLTENELLEQSHDSLGRKKFFKRHKTLLFTMLKSSLWRTIGIHQSVRVLTTCGLL